MNFEKLKEAEGLFMSCYPGGFSHPEMIAIGKKHKMNKMVEFAQVSLAKKNFKSPETIFENMIRIASRSSMPSLFENQNLKTLLTRLALKIKNCLLPD